MAVLGGSVQRSAAAPYPSRASAALRRRLVIGALVLVSLVLITISFRESDSGGLHRVQGVGASVLHPFQVGAQRVAQPFRDVYGYFHGLVNAKDENKKLKEEVRRLRAQANANALAADDAGRLRALLSFQDSPAWPQDYRAVNTRVISFAPGPFEQVVTIAAGSNQGVREHAPVVAADGLVGLVTSVFPRSAKVTLLTDPDTAVASLDANTHATGLLRHGLGNTLILDGVTKDHRVNPRDVVVTAGMQSARLPDLYPRGLPIGTVTKVNQTDVDVFKQIQITPFVDFSSLDVVAVLISTKPLPDSP